MKILRTPDERFEALSGFPFAPHYTEVADGDGGTLRVHHIDEGPRDGKLVLCMHGQPSWSYLYRHMLPILCEAGLRVIAPDLVGYGRSDKPAAREDYSYQRQVDWFTAWMLENDLRDATFFGQDWGGLIGLRMVAENPERFERVVVSTTGLPAPVDMDPKYAASLKEFREKLPVPTMPELMQAMSTPDPELPGRAFVYWQKFTWETEDLPGGILIAGSCGRALSAEEVAAYDAPFPDPSYKAGTRAMPSQVPTLPDDPSVPANLRAWKVFDRWEKPFLCAFGDQDPVTAGAEKPFLARVPGARGQPHTTIKGGSHFLQENRGEELARVIADWVRATS